MIFKVSVRLAFFKPDRVFRVTFFPKPTAKWQMKRFLKVTRHIEFGMMFIFFMVNIDIILGGKFE